MTDLLTEFIKKREEIGTKALAEALGIKASAVRMIATDNYGCSSDKILNAFAKQFINVVDCPYAKKVLQRSECVSRSTAPKPFGGAAKLVWWTACQTCVNKAEK